MKLDPTADTLPHQSEFQAAAALFDGVAASRITQMAGYVARWHQADELGDLGGRDAMAARIAHVAELLGDDVMADLDAALADGTPPPPSNAPAPPEPVDTSTMSHAELNAVIDDRGLDVDKGGKIQAKRDAVAEALAEE